MPESESVGVWRATGSQHQPAGTIDLPFAVVAIRRDGDTVPPVEYPAGHLGDVPVHGQFVLTAQIEYVDRRLKEMRRLRRDLSRLVTACRNRAPTDSCPALWAIEHQQPVGQVKVFFKSASNAR